MTVPRNQLVEWWPLVDVAQLRLGEGDVLVMRTTKRVTAPEAERMIDEWKRAMPGVRAIVLCNDEFDLAYQRPMREMRAEDLELPTRKTTME